MGKDSLIKINTVKLLSLEYRSGLACLAVFLECILESVLNRSKN